MSIAIGALGSLLILLAWIFEAIESIRKKKELVDVRFSFIYLAGALFLVFYSIIIEDPIFIVLNSIISILVASEILYAAFKPKRVKNKKYK